MWDRIRRFVSLPHDHAYRVLDWTALGLGIVNLAIAWHVRSVN